MPSPHSIVRQADGFFFGQWPNAPGPRGSRPPGCLLIVKKTLSKGPISRTCAAMFENRTARPGGMPVGFFDVKESLHRPDPGSVWLYACLGSCVVLQTNSPKAARMGRSRKKMRDAWVEAEAHGKNIRISASPEGRHIHVRMPLYSREGVQGNHCGNDTAVLLSGGTLICRKANEVVGRSEGGAGRRGGAETTKPLHFCMGFVLYGAAPGVE